METRRNAPTDLKKMAKKRNEKQVLPVVSETFSCGDCIKAYGYCKESHDGKPIFCRCDIHTGHLMMCDQKACSDFGKRTEPIPTVFPKGYSEDRHPSLKSKVVPVFSEEDPKVVKEYVPVKRSMDK